MPLPLSTALLLGAVALSRIPSLAVQIIAYVLVGLGILNEVVRALVTTRAVSATGQYDIPAVGDPRLRERTPIRHDDE